MPAVPPSTSIVGFFLHLTEKSGCGDVAFWATRAPKGKADIATEEDMRLNGSTHSNGERRLDFYGNDTRWTQCHRCGAWYKLHIKHYRSIPHPADLGRTAAADHPVRGIDLRADVLV